MQMKLDATWIDDALADRNSGASTVITVQTSDPERSRQLTTRLVELFPASFYQFRPWIGLEMWMQKEQSFAKVEPSQPTDEFAARDDLRDLGAALRHMDKVMRIERAGKTAFVLRDLDKTTDSNARNAVLVDALRYWSTDNRILAKGSVICLIATDPATVLDRGTLDSIILARPEVASDSERLSLVQGFVTEIRDRMDSNAIHGLASAARGLNLHQAAVVLRKSYAPNQKLTIEDVKHHKADYIRRSDVLEIEEPTVGFQDVGGYEPVKEMVRQP